MARRLPPVLLRGSCVPPRRRRVPQGGPPCEPPTTPTPAPGRCRTTRTGRKRARTAWLRLAALAPTARRTRAPTHRRPGSRSPGRHPPPPDAYPTSLPSRLSPQPSERFSARDRSRQTRRRSPAIRVPAMPLMMASTPVNVPHRGQEDHGRRNSPGLQEYRYDRLLGVREQALSPRHSARKGEAHAAVYRQPGYMTKGTGISYLRSIFRPMCSDPSVANLQPDVSARIGR